MKTAGSFFALGMAAMFGAGPSMPECSSLSTSSVANRRSSDDTSPDKPIAAIDQTVELDADRKPGIVTHGDCFIKNGTLLTVTNGVIEGGSILVKGGKIAAIGKNLVAPDGVPVIDATGKVVSPGIIDAHSHIAADEVNEG